MVVQQYCTQYNNLVRVVDVAINAIYQIIYPLRLMFFMSGGFVYWIYHLIGKPHQKLAQIVAKVLGGDPYFLQRCTNSRNYALMVGAYWLVTLLIPPLRWISYIPAMVFLYAMRELYLVPCPVMRMESLMNPVSEPHKHALESDYNKVELKSIHPLVTLDLIHCCIRIARNLGGRKI